MVESTQVVSIKTTKNFYEKLKLLLCQAFGFPHDDINWDIKEALKLADTYSYLFLMHRRGVQQNLNQPISTKLKAIHILYRVLVILSLIRHGIVITIDGAQELVLVADPVKNYPNGRSLHLIFFLTFSIYGIIREYTLYLEEKGTFIQARDFEKLYLDGFSCEYVKLTEEETKSCKFWFILLFEQILRSLKTLTVITTVFVPIVLRYQILDEMLQDKCLIFTSIFWALGEVISFTVCFNGAVSTSLLLLPSVIIYYWQLISLINTTKTYHSSSRTNVGFHVRSLNYSITKFLNTFHDLVYSVKTLLFIYMICISFLADTYIFMGAIIHIIDDFDSNVLTIAGFYGFTIISIVSYILGCFQAKCHQFYVNLVKLLTGKNVDLATYYKTMGILDRLIHPETGGRVGDMIVICRDFFIFYAAENISIIFLLTCDLRSAILS